MLTGRTAAALSDSEGTCFFLVSPGSGYANTFAGDDGGVYHFCVTREEVVRFRDALNVALDLATGDNP